MIQILPDHRLGPLGNQKSEIMNIDKIKEFWEKHVKNRPLGVLLFLASCLYLYFGIYQLPELGYFLSQDEQYLETFESENYFYALDFPDPWSKREFFPPGQWGRAPENEIGSFIPNPIVLLRLNVPDRISAYLVQNSENEDVKKIAIGQLNIQYRSEYKNHGSGPFI